MHPLPHHYTISARAAAVGDVALTGEKLAPIAGNAPAEFDGPGDKWSPETLQLAAVAHCYVLTFRAIAQLAKLPWTDLQCVVDGTLDRVERAMQFTAFTVRPTLTIPQGGDADAARSALQRTERNCLISNSLKAKVQVDAQVRFG